MRPVFHKKPLMKLVMEQLPMPNWVRESSKIHLWAEILEEEHLGETYDERKERLKVELKAMDFDWIPRRGDGSSIYEPLGTEYKEEEVPF
jgi:hypothetical protein